MDPKFKIGSVSVHSENQRYILKECTKRVCRPPDKVHAGKLFFLFRNQNICCGYSKEPSQ